MALTRELLKGLGIEGLTDDAIKTIMDEHGNTVNANRRSAEEAQRQLQEQLNARPDISSEDLEKLRCDLTAATETLKSYKGVDVPLLQRELSSSKEELVAMKSQSEKTILDLQKDMLLRERLAVERFSSDYARDGIYNDIKKEVSYEPGEDGALGALSGYDEALSSLREKKPSAFAPEDEGSKKKDEGRQHRNVDERSHVKRELPKLI